MENHHLPARVALQSKRGRNTPFDAIDAFVQQAIADGVKIIATAGVDSEWLHDTIDETIVGDGSAAVPHILTTWHDDLDDALALLSELDEMEFPGQPFVMEL
jgi:hypothetical protein